VPRVLGPQLGEIPGETPCHASEYKRSPLTPEGEPMPVR